jgi:hypothetical protein
MAAYEKAPATSEPISVGIYVSSTQERARDAKIERDEKERRAAEQASSSSGKK